VESEVWVVQSFLHFVQTIKLADVLDILAVYGALLYVMYAIRGTRAVQILQGTGIVLIILLLAHLLQFKTLIWLLNWFLVSLAVVLPIIFQPELRRALMRLGQQGILSATTMSKLDKSELVPLIDELAFAAFSLGQVRIGALMVLEQDTGLQEYVEQGQTVEGLVSAKLLISIFHPKSPLHDGAVIIRGRRIAAAACFLDSIHDQDADDRFGTRHRAALSLSAQTDCVVVVVSEETGQVRIAYDGNFSRPLEDEGEIKKVLTQYIVAPQQPDSGRRLTIPVPTWTKSTKVRRT